MHDHESSDGFEPNKTPVARFDTLEALIRRLPDHATLPATSRELYVWAELMHNDRARGADLPDMPFAQGDISVELGLAILVLDALRFLLGPEFRVGQQQHVEGMETLSNLLFFTESIWSRAEYQVDAHEFPDHEQPPIIFPVLWNQLDAHREELHRAITVRVTELACGPIASFTVSQVVALDRLRDTWLHLMLNYIYDLPSQLSR